VCTAVSHLGGWVALYTLIAGGTVVLLDEFDPKTVLEAIERERVTDTFLTPNYLYRLLDHPALDTTDLSSLKQILYSGCAVSPHRLAEAVRRIGPVFSQIYGQNEVGVISTLTPKDHLRPELLGTAGQVVPHVEVEIRDEFGNVVPIGGGRRDRRTLTGRHDRLLGAACGDRADPPGRLVAHRGPRIP
jgi:fatty-acyl-CoA synthase